MRTFTYFVPVMLFIEVGYLFILMYFVPYKTRISTVGVFFCTFTEFYSLLLPFITQFVQISTQVFSMMMIVLFCLLFTSIILALIRVCIVYKKIFIKCLKGDPKLKNPSVKVRQHQNWKEPLINQHLQTSKSKQCVNNQKQKL